MACAHDGATSGDFVMMRGDCATRRRATTGDGRHFRYVTARQDDAYGRAAAFTAFFHAD